MMTKRLQDKQSILNREIKLWVKIGKLCNESDFPLIYREIDSIPMTISKALGGELQFLFNQLKLRKDRKDGSLKKLTKKLEEKFDRKKLDRFKVVTLILWGLRVVKSDYFVQLKNQQINQINVEFEEENDRDNQICNLEEPEDGAHIIEPKTSFQNIQNEDIQIDQQVSNEEPENEANINVPIRSSQIISIDEEIQIDSQIIQNEKTQIDSQVAYSEKSVDKTNIIEATTSSQIVPNEGNQIDQHLSNSEETQNENSELPLTGMMNRSVLEWNKCSNSSSATALIFNNEKKTIKTEQNEPTIEIPVLDDPTKRDIQINPQVSNSKKSKYKTTSINAPNTSSQIIPNEKTQIDQQLSNSKEPENEAYIIEPNTSSQLVLNADIQFDQQVTNSEKPQVKVKVNVPTTSFQTVSNEETLIGQHVSNCEEPEDEANIIEPNTSNQISQQVSNSEETQSETSVPTSSGMLRRSDLERHKNPHSTSATALIFNNKKKTIKKEPTTEMPELDELTKREINMWRFVFNFCNRNGLNLSKPQPRTQMVESFLKEVLTDQTRVDFLLSQLQMRMQNPTLIDDLVEKLKQGPKMTSFPNTYRDVINYAKRYLSMIKRETTLWSLLLDHSNSTPPIDLRSNPDLDLKTVMKREDNVTFFIDRLRLYMENSDMLEKLKNRLQKELTVVYFGNTSDGLVEWAMRYVRRTRDQSRTDRTIDISTLQRAHVLPKSNELNNQPQCEIIDRPVKEKGVCQINQNSFKTKTRKSKYNLRRNKCPTSEIVSHSSKRLRETKH